MRVIKNRKIKLNPLPEGVEVGKLVRYYSNGWYIGQLRSVKGNTASIVRQGYGADAKRHNAKLIPFMDIKKIEN
jgi:hypothetical protein